VQGIKKLKHNIFELKCKIMASPISHNVKQPSVEAKAPPVSAPAVTQHIAHNSVKKCHTCSENFKGKGKYCLGCKQKYGENKAKVAKIGQTVVKPPAPVASLKVQQDKKCKCGCKIEKIKFDICQACYLKTKPVVQGPNAASQTQARSKFQPDYAVSDKHSAMVNLYHTGSTHPDLFFGTMTKVKDSSRTIFIINQHQLTSDTYILNDKKEKIPLMLNVKWTKAHELGKDTLWSTPASSFQIPHCKALAMGAFGCDSKTVQMYGVDPTNMKPYMCATEAQKTPDGYLAHSVTTSNNHCGGFLFDQNLGTIVGIHCRTNGPSDRGSNNFAVPLF
jgi:hypothetical protein